MPFMPRPNVLSPQPQRFGFLERINQVATSTVASLGAWFGADYFSDYFGGFFA